jgi:predicted DNA-binding protein with PD1-like motif
MEVVAIRLRPNQDLKKSLQRFALHHNISAGFILSAVGSLKQAKIRFANQQTSTLLSDKFEIISLNGTIAIVRRAPSHCCCRFPRSNYPRTSGR